MADDEIDVDGYVMKKDVRGTSRDPRALRTEQWNVKVRMTENGREFNVPTEQTRWERLKSGDRVKVKYSQGNYTGTIWGAEIGGGGRSPEWTRRARPSPRGVGRHLRGRG